MRGLISNIGNVILTILVVLLIGYGFAFIELKIMLKPNIELFGYVFYQQNNDEMATDFFKDDIIIIKKDETFKEGDKIFYLADKNQYKVHNVIHTDAISTVTKCSTCDENNPAIDNSRIIGKAIGKVSFLGKFITIFRQKWVLMTFGIIGFILVVLGQYLDTRPPKKVATTI